ncbi:MAG: type II toxin-antitoxin system PemK/MazF family toxin [Candidatus Aminicenantes bacterium]|nr:MAG: type II toxin-antitoxin system PemK/MazF family toxin [Candidatus Aminicenantes bacterium]
MNNLSRLDIVLKANSFFFVPVSPGNTTGLVKESLINTQQIRTIDKTRIQKKMGSLPKRMENSLDYALSLAVGTDEEEGKKGDRREERRTLL